MSEERGGFPRPVGGLVEELLRARGLLEGVQRASTIGDWTERVGPQIARVATPVGFDRGILFVEVRSSAWLMELEMMERRILERLNAGRGRAGFKKIIFRLAEGR
jgi:predicted nucleic acid-binding Zn ribbon protein